MAGFIFSADPNSGFASYNDLQRQRAVAQALARSALGSTPRNVGEGLTALGRALAYRFAADNLADKEKAVNGQITSALSGLIGAAGAPAVASPATPAIPSIPPEALSGTPMSDTAAPLSGGNIAPNINAPDQYKPLIEKAAQQYNVPPELLTRQLNAESSFNPNAVSGAGAQGIAQFMPATAKQMGVNPFDPTSAIPGAARYLAQNYAKFGSWPLALAAYNAGPGRVDQMLASGGGMKALPAETQGYVSKIMSGLGSLLGPTQAQAAEAPPEALAFNGTPQATPAPARAAVVNALAGNQPSIPSGPLQAPPVGAFTPQNGPEPTITNLPVKPTTLPIGNAHAAPSVTPQPMQSRIPPNIAASARKLIATGDPRGLSLAEALIKPYLGPQTYGFQMLPDGTIVRTDKNTGTVTPVYRGTGEKPTSDIINYHQAQSQGYKGTFQQFQTEMKNAGRPVNLGPAPKGYMYAPGVDGSYSLKPIPGGPAAQAETEQAGAKQTTTDVVSNAYETAKKLIGTDTTGIIGKGVAAVLPPSDAAELRRQVHVLTSNASISALNAMRRQSKTGGALGNVTESEERILAATAGAINPDSSPAQFKAQLDNYYHTLLRIVNGPEAGDRMFEQMQHGQMPTTGTPSAAPLTSGTTQSGIKWSVH